MMENIIVKMTFSVFGSPEYRYPNNVSTTFFNRKWIILNPYGILFPESFKTKEQAFKYIEKLFHYGSTEII
jgi:hypothetical protein